MAKISFLDKLPKLFFGAILGITFGAMAGGLFDGMEIPLGTGTLAWQSIFIFLGAIFGALIGFNEE